jgi:hypothetical protein
MFSRLSGGFEKNNPRLALSGPLVDLDQVTPLVARLQGEVARLTDELANHDSASKLMGAWVSEKGQMPWVTAINILAIATHMPDDERQRLIDMDDGTTERGALIAERDAIKVELERFKKANGELSAECVKRRNVNYEMQSELTKARECIAEIRAETVSGTPYDIQLLADAFLANQAAPAAKGGE